MDKCNQKSHSGFTLLEMLVAVAIMGILAAVAYPAYRDYVVKTRRADAQGVLVLAADALERYRIRNNFRYSDAALEGSASPCDTAAANQVVFKARAPLEGEAVNYALTLVCTASTFTLTATPKSSSSQAGDGVMTLDQAGLKTWADPEAGNKNCWAPKGHNCS